MVGFKNIQSHFLELFIKVHGLFQDFANCLEF